MIDEPDPSLEMFKKGMSTYVYYDRYTWRIRPDGSITVYDKLGREMQISQSHPVLVALNGWASNRIDIPLIEYLTKLFGKRRG